MKVLVTGATGLLGNNVVRLLLDRGYEVRVLSRTTSDARPLKGLPVEVALGDVREMDSVRRAVRDVQQIVHSAAHVQIGWTGLELQRAINVGGTSNVAQAALESQARMVHVSSVDALGLGTATEPGNEDTPRVGKIGCPYVVTKREAEEALRAAISEGLDATIVNPGFMIGPWDWKPSSGKMMLEVARRYSPLAPTGGCSLCDARDVAAGILAALERGRRGTNYILGGYNQTYFDIFRMFSQLGGNRPPFMKMGPAQRYLAGFVGDCMTRITKREPAINSAAVAMSSLYNYHSSDRAREELGYANRPIVETLRDSWEWFQQNEYVTWQKKK